MFAEEREQGERGSYADPFIRIVLRPYTLDSRINRIIKPLSYTEDLERKKQTSCFSSLPTSSPAYVLI